MSASNANRRLANQVRSAITVPVSWDRGRVTVVNATTPPTVTVQPNGGTVTITCRYVKGYTPVVGDVCEIIRQGSRKIALFLA